MAKPPKRSNEIGAVVGGKRRRLHLNAYGLMLALEQGFDLGELASIAGDEGEDLTPKQQAERFRTSLRLLWIARLPFEPDLTFEDSSRQVEFSEIEGIQVALVKAQDRQAGDIPDPLAEALNGRQVVEVQPV